MEISVTMGASVFKAAGFTFASGMSIVRLQEPIAKIGLALESIKVSCAECNTPVAEVSAGSLIIRSRHHGERHVSIFSKDVLNNIL